MVKLFTESVVINDRRWNQTKAGYPERPTVYSGVSVSFGADSCLEHPDASKASLSLWLPKLYRDWLPGIGDVVKVRAGFVDGNSMSPSVQVFAGKIDSVVIEDDKQPEGATYVPVNVGAGWRNVSKSTWTVEANTGDITDSVTIINNHSFSVPIKGDTGEVIRVNTPKLNVTTGMDYQFTVGKRPLALQNFKVTAKSYNSLGGVVQTVDYPRADTGTFRVPVDSNVTTIRLILSYTLNGSTESSVEIGDVKLLQLFKDKPTGTRYPGYRINIQCSDALAQGGRLRIGAEPWTSVTGLYRLAQVAELAAPAGVNFLSGPMSAELGAPELVSVRARSRDIDSANALEIYRKTAMSAGLTVGSVDNVITPNYKLLLPQVLDKTTNGAFVTELQNKYSGRAIPVVPVGAIVDSAFALDATETVNQVKINYFVRRGNAAHKIGQEYVDVEETNMLFSTPSVGKLAPVTRVLDAENQVEDPTNGRDDMPLDSVNPLIVRATAALSAQSVPHWRLAQGMELVLNKLPFSANLVDLIEEAGRFGQVVRIDGVPEFIDNYQRIKSGRIVLGENSSLEFELEPVDYSGPAALTKSAALSDPKTAVILISDLKTITSDTLRSVGAR